MSNHAKSSAPPPPPPPHQKQTFREYILSNPNDYIRSVVPVTKQMWIYRNETDHNSNKIDAEANTTKVEQRELIYVPALYAVFEAILCDLLASKQATEIRIVIKERLNEIRIEIHGADDNCIHLTTHFGKNISLDQFDYKKNVTDATLCNIFSTNFCVETV